MHVDEEHSHVYATITTETPDKSAEGHAVRVRRPQKENDHDHAHEHCHACSEQRGASALRANDRLASFDLEGKNAGVMESEAPTLLRPVHKTAPKASPPA